MNIHVVEPGDTIDSIAKFYGVSADILIRDNGLVNADNLVVGQCIIIAYPKCVYIVQEGDTLINIAKSHNISIMELLQNNPFLSDIEYIYPGDRLIISYDKKGKLATHGIVMPYIDRNPLRKPLPYLTTLSVINYTVTDDGDIISYYNDTDIIQIIKDYNTLPLMFLTTLTLQGEANLRATYDIILNEEYQDRLLENILTILREKDFYGINISFEYVSKSNLPYIESAFSRLSSRITEEGFVVIATINPNMTLIGDEVYFAKVNYYGLSNIAEGITFMNYEWSITSNPPSPVSSINSIKAYLDYLVDTMPVHKINIGITNVGYSWELPYVSGISEIHIITYDNAIRLAWDEGVDIEFDEVSLTPFFAYAESQITFPRDYIVWFIDARTINALLDLVRTYNLQGTGVWNITSFNNQLWLLINSQFNIVKYDLIN